MKAEQVAIDPVKPISKKKETETLVARDVILQKLLDVSAREKTSAIVSKHYFHEAFLNDEQEEEKKDDENNSPSQLAIQSATRTTKSGGESTKKRHRSEDGDAIPAPNKRKMTAAKSIVKKQSKKAAIQPLTINEVARTPKREPMDDTEVAKENQSEAEDASVSAISSKAGIHEEGSTSPSTPAGRLSSLRNLLGSKQRSDSEGSWFRRSKRTKLEGTEGKADDS
jgi:hypothetical protein